MSSNTALEEMHHIEHHVQVGRARAGVIMLIISDAISVVAILAAGGYLNALNTMGQYRAGDHPPAYLPGLLGTIVLILSGVMYYMWERTVRRDEAGGGQRPLFMLSLALMIVSFAIQVYVCATLGYGSPFHAYASLIVLLTWYSAFHLLLAAIIGILLLGRIFRGRLAEHGFVAEVTGYWWYYTVAAGLLMWLAVAYI